MFRHLLVLPGTLSILLGAFWIVSGAILRAFKRLGGQVSFPESHLKRPDSHLLALVSYLQRLDSQFQLSAATKPVLRQLIAVCKQCYLLPVERGQGRAAGAAEDHMTCLEVL